MSSLVSRMKSVVKTADLRSGGWITVFQQSAYRFTEMRGAEAAASLAYYGLFSIFPLTLFLIAILGFVVTSQVAFQQAVQFVGLLFPFSGDLVVKNLSQVVEARGTVGILGTLGLLWSALSFFNVLAVNVNRAWPMVKLRGAVHSRLVALAMVGVLFALLLFSLVSTTLINLLPFFVWFFGGDSASVASSGWSIFLRLVPGLFTYLMFISLYRWVPNKTVSWQAVLVGGLIATTAWELSKSLFALYLGSGLVQFQVVYGSLATLIVLMVWIYVSSMITLFGAHLVATLDVRTEQKRSNEVLEPHLEKEFPKGVHG